MTSFRDSHFAIRDYVEALQIGLEQKAKEFAKKGAEVYAKAKWIIFFGTSALICRI